MYPIVVDNTSGSLFLAVASTTSDPINISYYATFLDLNTNTFVTFRDTSDAGFIALVSTGAEPRVIRQLVIKNRGSQQLDCTLQLDSVVIDQFFLGGSEKYTLGGIYDANGALKTGVQGPSGPPGPPGTPAPTELEESAQTGNYTLQLSDALKFVTINSSSNSTVTIPPNSSTAFPLGTQILVGRKGTGSVIISPSSGVTLNGGSGSSTLGAQWAGVATLWKYGTDDWWIFGGLS